MDTIIQTVIDEYFITNDKNPKDYNLWVPRETAYSKAAEIKEERKAKHTRAVAHHRRIENEAAKRFNEIVKKHSMVHLTTASLGIEPPKGDIAPAMKRPLAEEEKAERMNTHKRQKKAWLQMVNLQEQAHKSLMNYNAKFGTVGAPIEPEFWLELVDGEDDEKEDIKTGDDKKDDDKKDDDKKDDDKKDSE